MEFLIGVVIGGFITYFVERLLQNRQFKKEEKARIDSWRCYLEALRQEIETEYKRLWQLRDVGCRGYPQDYFDTTVKRTILQEIIKTPLFVTHQKVFSKISSLIQRYEAINSQSALVRDILSDKYTSIEDKKAKLSFEQNILFDLADDAILDDMAESDGKPSLAIELEEIKNSIEYSNKRWKS